MADDKDVVDKFYCAHCDEYVFAMSLPILCDRLNNHNKVRHPLDFSSWTPDNVILSAHYAGPANPKGRDQRPDKIIVHVTESKNNWGSAKKPPNITEEDKVFLKGGLVLWDE